MTVWYAGCIPDSYPHRITSTKFCKNTVVSPEDGPISTPNTQRLININIKAVPLQAWTGPEGSRKLRFPDFVTTAQDGGKVVSPMHRPPLPPGNAPGTNFC